MACHAPTSERRDVTIWLSDVIKFKCPRCGAAAQEPCVALRNGMQKKGLPVAPHNERWREARRATSTAAGSEESK